MSENKLSVYPHETLDDLFLKVAEAIEEIQAGADPAVIPVPLPVVVDGHQLQERLQIHLAEKLGVCMGLRFVKPRNFLSEVLARAGLGEASAWSRRELTWRILSHLPQYATLALEDAANHARDHLAVASLLADRLDQYGHYRPELLRAWQKKQPLRKSKKGTSTASAESWQQKLWQTLQEEISVPHPTLQLLDLNIADDCLGRAFPRVLVLGTGLLDPLLVLLLQKLSLAGCQVDCHHVLPSLSYLGELYRSQSWTELCDSPENEPPAEGHPLLYSLGKQAIGAFYLLSEMDENFTHWPDDRTAENSSRPASLLQSIQADIRALRNPGHAVKFILKKDDISLRIHHCHGPRREMEVLREELLRAFTDLPGLQPGEVLILASDLDTYRALVPVLEGSEKTLPVRLTEIPPQEQNPLLEGIFALLQMSMGRAASSELIDLLHLQAVRQKLGTWEDAFGLQRLCDWVKASGQTEDFDVTFRIARGLAEDSTGTWEFARDRLIAGYWFGADERVQSASHQQWILPVADRLGTGRELLRTFLSWHFQLSAQLREWKLPATAADWSVRLTKVAERLLEVGSDEQSYREWQACLVWLSAQPCMVKVDAGAMQDWLQGWFQEYSASRSPAIGAIAMGRFQQLQNFPCRVLAMVGMQDTAFPRHHLPPSWDLLNLQPARWDRNPREDDRQMFLHALLAVHDRLIVTANSQNLRTGQAEPLSSCVDELLRVAGSTAECLFGSVAQHVQVRHLRQPFSLDYYQKTGSRLPHSFSVTHLKSALALQVTNPTEPVFYQSVPTGEPTRQHDILVTLEELARFWKNPAREFLFRLGIQLPGDEEDEKSLDHFTLQHNALEVWSIKSRIVEDYLRFRDRTQHYLFRQMQADRMMPLGYLGDHSWRNMQKIQNLGHLVEMQSSSVQSADFFLPKKDVPPIRLSGQLTIVKCKGGDALLSYRVGQFQKFHHFLKPWMTALLANANGCPLPSILFDESSIQTGSGRLLAAIKTEEARDTLDSLLHGYWQGRSHLLCFAPQTSWSMSKWLEKESADAVYSRAASGWQSEGYFNQVQGDGCDPAVMLAWRGLDPFQAAFQEEWFSWVEKIVAPLRKWSKL